MNKKIILTLLLFIPCFIDALSYNNSFVIANKYITERENYNLYLDTKIDKYAYNNGKVEKDINFFNAGYVNKYEYEVAGGRDSYLYNGGLYYTMTEIDNVNVYYISNESEDLKNISKTMNTNYGYRTTHYVKENAKVYGIGTYNNPFRFLSPDVDGPIVSYDKTNDTTYTKSKTIIVTFTDDSKIRTGQSVKYLWQKSASCPSKISEYTESSALGQMVESNDSYYASASISTPEKTGLYYLCIAPGIEDANGNSSSRSYAGPYHLDNEEPKIALSKNSDTTYTQNKQIKVTVTDNIGIEKNQTIKYRWQTSNTCSTNANDYTSLTLTYGTNNLSATADVSLIEKTGEYYLCILSGVKDTLGNESKTTASTGKFYVDNKGPVITKVDASDGQGQSIVKVTASDANSTIEGYYYGYSQTQSECTPQDYSTSSTHTYSNFSNGGTYYFCAKVVDSLGNESEVMTDTATIITDLTYAQISTNYSCKNASVGSDYVFVYTGDCEIFDDSPSLDSTSTGKEGSWRIKFLTSGDLTFNNDINVDAFLVGGGGSGGSSGSMVYSGGGGGGGGYTTTTTNIKLIESNKYSITIGAAGGTTSAFDYTANGGTNGGRETPGSGGNSGGTGGENDCDCVGTSGGSYGNGKTCEFSEGTSAGCNRGDNFAYSAGGAGGGGATKNCTGTYTECGGGSSGKGLSGANSGKGGRGAQGGKNASSGGSGYSGVVVIRDAR